jgi:hypothetical protein
MRVVVLLALLCLMLSAACSGAAAALPDRAPGAPPAQGVGASSLDVERIARNATWAPGSLQDHFEKHGREGPYASAQAYDAAARETIRQGDAFRYVDRSTNARRLGFYHAPTNRFTGMTDDARRITTHFKPDNGERYVRDLPQSTYR